MTEFDPTAGGQWTRDDLPRIGTADPAHDSVVDGILETVVHWLNAHHPKPERSAMDYAEIIAFEAARATRAERERDAAVARAEMAEQLIPRYAMLDVWGALGRDSIHFDDWHDEQGYADAWAELVCDVRDCAEAAEARIAPAVTRADIEKAIRGKVWAANREPNKAGFHRVHVDWATDAVWALLSGADPVVYVVRESDVEAQVALRNRFGEFVVNGTVLNVTTAEDCREKAQRHLDAVARCESIARTIEAEQATDPVEEQTDMLADILYGHEMVTDQMRGVLERVVRAGMLFPEQEASSDE